MCNTAHGDDRTRRPLRFVAATGLALLAAACTHMQRTDTMQEPLSSPDLKAVAPAFERYTTHTVFDGLWKRPHLSPRDRSIVTLSVLI
ncbi:carboxymuconolactone decarboxylase family protein, partial [Burkholderia cepacia]